MRTTPGWQSGATLALALACAGCAGSGEGLDANGRPPGEGPPANDLYTQIQQSIFTPICTTCHAGAAAPLGLRLDAGNSYALLVGVPSVQVPSLQRVAAGDPDASYVVHKVEGRAAVGDRMPLGGPPLPQTSIDLVRQWIASGAPPPAGAALEPLRLMSTIPAEGERAELAATIVVIFNHPIDASLAQAGVFTLHANDREEITFERIEVSGRNPAMVLLRLADALPAGSYSLEIRGTGPTALADVHARTLGRDHRVAFTVAER